MIKKLVLSSILAALSLSPLFALDEYMPIGPRAMAIDIGFQRTVPAGTYNSAGKSDSRELAYKPLYLPLQGKYGLTDNIEGSLDVKYILKSIEDKSGFDRPTLGLKYADPQLGLGGFLGITLPVGFTDIVSADPYASLIFGALYGKNWGDCKFLANASYQFDTEDLTGAKIDNIRVFAKPEYSLPFGAWTNTKQTLSLYVAGEYTYYLNEVLDGKSTSDDGKLLNIIPGINYSLNRVFGLEISMPYAVMGAGPTTGYEQHRVYEERTIKAVLHFSLDESLYNNAK